MIFQRFFRNPRNAACGGMRLWLARAMRGAPLALLCTGILSGVTAYAQGWELGVIGGFGYQPKFDVIRAAGGTASTGFKNGAVIGVYAGEDTYRYWSGEARYLYQYSDAKVESGSVETSFAAHTHILTGDFLGHFRPTGAKIRPFIIFGGGVKIIVGTGAESAGQPLGNFAALTHTHETLGVGDIGAGFKYNVGKHYRIRAEVHDYIGHAPSQVIAVAPGASMSGISNDIIATGSMAVTW